MLTETETLRAPFPWFGGKSRIASLVWARFGNVPNYIEPFAGSLAVLLGRPHDPKVETVNDVDAYLANFWRALQHEPEHVAYWADWPVNEADLHARHRWLVDEGRERVERLKTEPEFYDCKIAGWWVWGQCLWIGSGWCSLTDKRNQNPSEQRKKPRAGEIGANRRWQGGGQGGGSGVHAPTLTAQKPSTGGHFLMDQWSATSGLQRSQGLYGYLTRLSMRLRRVRVCCGDWERVLTPSVTTYMGVTGVLLDPPYSHELRERCYAEDHDISAAVRAWALENGDNPDFRIALCGYEDEHGEHMPASWECVRWKAHGGYSRSERGKENRTQERVWFSPHCLRPSDQLQFDAEAI